MRDDASRGKHYALGVGGPDVRDSTTWAARPMAEWRERGYVPDSDDEDDVSLGVGTITANLLEAPNTPVTSQKPGSVVVPDEKKICDQDLERTGGTVPATTENDALSQEVRHTLSAGRRSSDDEELLQPYSLAKSPTGTSERKRISPVGSQPGLSETIEADNAVHAASVGDKLQAELEYGLQSVKQILGIASVQSRSNSINRSLTSSPLSSIRSFTDDDENVAGAATSQPLHVQAIQAPTVERMDLDYQNGTPRYAGRDLRRRRPIQLHPYALEDARYQQELKARGLKPVRIAASSSGTHQNLAANDTQEQDLYSDSPMDDSGEAKSIEDSHRTLYSQHASSPGLSRAARYSSPPAFFNDDEELPELSAILKGDIRDLYGRKRRKLEHKSSKEASQPLGRNDFHVPDLPPVNLDRHRRGDTEIDMLETPPSPPRSSSSDVSKALVMPSERRRPPQRTTPRGLPTPVEEYSDTSDSSEDSQLDHHSTTEFYSLSADMGHGKGIQSMQRRSKGVLPASWLTLDLGKQTGRNRLRKPPVDSPVVQPGAKGVAQRLKTSRPRNSVAVDEDVSVIDISDDSSEDMGPSSEEKGTSWDSCLYVENDDFAVPSLDDLVEDNRIDVMAPSASRSGRRAKLPTKRQRTLDESFGPAAVPQSGHSEMLQAKHWRKKQPTAIGRGEARRKHRSGKFLLSSLQPGVLDAPAFAQFRMQDQPQFLRVVARRARAQKSKRRVGKSQKSMRLISEDDRHDVNSVPLHQPENRSIFQENKTPVPARIPAQQPLWEYHLSPQTSDLPNSSTKTPRTAIHNPDETVSLKNSTAATIRRILLRQVGTLAATTLDNTSITPKARSVHSQHGLPRILLSHYQNRSGKGRLTSSLAPVREPRSAQLEASQSPGHLENRAGALHSHLAALDRLSIRSTTAAVTAHDFNPSLPRRAARAEAFPLNNSAVQGLSSRKRAPQHRDLIARVRQQPIDPPTPAAPANATRLVDIQQESSKLGGDRIAAILQKGEMTALRVGTFYHESTFIGSGDLVKTVLKIVEIPRNFDLDTGRICSFSLPQANSHYNWGAWNDIVASQLRSVRETLLRECSTAMTTGQNIARATLQRFMLYMRTIIGYINDVLYFEEATARTSCVTTCVEIVLSMVVAIQSNERRLPGKLEGDALHMLNHVAVLAYQVSHIASTQTVNLGLQVRAWNLFDTIARGILSLALGSRGQLKLIEYLEANKIHSTRESGIRMNYPEVDALVIVPHLCQGKTSGESCSTMIGNILTTKVEGHDASHTRDRLAEVMLFAWTVAPYFFIDASGCLSKKRPSATDFSSWPVIVPVFEAFLKSRAHSQDPNASDNVMGRRYVSFCLHLATGWGWIDCAGLIQLLRIYYGTNNMDELFAERSRSSRNFLEKYPEYGRIAFPADNDSGFDSFLKLIIVSGVQKASRGEKTSHLSNFIFSLVPNSGQVLRKDQDHDLQALRPLQNRHDLYSALYFVSPLETKIRLLPQIQSLVDVRESHISACMISFKTLVRLARFQISADEDLCVLRNFGELIQEMIKKTEEQFDAARVEAFAHVRGRPSGSDALKIMRFNQDKIQKFLTHIIRAWSDCIQGCRTPGQARELLFGEDLGAVLGLCARTTTLDSVENSNMEAFKDEVIEVILSTVTSYIVNWLPKAEDLRAPVDKLHLLLKTVVSTQLGRYQQCSDEILRSLSYCWHALAKVSVDRGIRSWDSYLSLGGRDAWQSFDDTWHKSQYEVYFAALFLESNEGVWREWQVPMLQLWIASLLVPEARFKYQAELTTQIMRYDASCNPLLFHLPLVLYEDKVLVKVHLDELIAARTALILALLRNMNKSTTRPDSQDCFFGPSEDECCSILKMMMALMRQYLEELEQEPAEQEIYADFVGRVLSEMRIYTTHLEPVPEEFEYIPGKFLPVAPGTIKAKLSLYRQLMAENGMEKHMIVFLHTAAERAAITGQQEAFENQLVGVFLDLTTESLEDAQGYAADAHFRTLFFQNVFPAYLDRIFYGSGFIVARPVLGCILSVYQGLRFRFGLWTREFLEPFITATLSLLSTLKTTLAGSIVSPEHILTEPSQVNAYSFLCSIMSEILCRYREMEDSFGTFSELSDIWEYFLFFYKYTLMVAFRPPRALPEELLDDNDQTELLEPKLSASDDTMLAYARRELGDMLDSKWVPGIDGTWFVKRAGGRKEQVHGVVVGSPEQEMGRMQAAAERYVRVFAAAWNAE